MKNSQQFLKESLHNNMTDFMQHLVECLEIDRLLLHSIFQKQSKLKYKESPEYVEHTYCTC